MLSFNHHKQLWQVGTRHLEKNKNKNKKTESFEQFVKIMAGNCKSYYIYRM